MGTDCQQCTRILGMWPEVWDSPRLLAKLHIVHREDRSKELQAAIDSSRKFIENTKTTREERADAQHVPIKDFSPIETLGVGASPSPDTRQPGEEVPRKSQPR